MTLQEILTSIQASELSVSRLNEENSLESNLPFTVNEKRVYTHSSLKNSLMNCMTKLEDSMKKRPFLSVFQMIGTCLLIAQNVLCNGNKYGSMLASVASG